MEDGRRDTPLPMSEERFLGWAESHDGLVELVEGVVDLQSGKGNARATVTPIAVVEVLAASTGYDEHVAKFATYRMRSSLKQYAVFEQTRPRACVWLKGEGGRSVEPTIYDGLDHRISFPDVGAFVDMAEIYRRTGPRSDDTG